MSLSKFYHRRTLLPFLAKQLKIKSYLEIGVKGGKTFLPLKIRKKYAVDPVFKIKKDYKRSQIFKFTLNLFAEYYECESNEFFAAYAPMVLKNKKLDMAFIDGLHTFEQSYIDIVNTLPYLKEDGIMVVHDCSPKSEAAAYPANSIADVKKINPPGFDGLWSGDVWKIVPKLKLNFPELFIFVIDQDSGLAVISRKPLVNFSDQLQNIEYTEKDIELWDYSYLNQNRVKLLNLVNDKQLQEVANSLLAYR